MAYLMNVGSPSDMANWVRQNNVPKVPNLGYLAGRPNQALERGVYNLLPLQPTVHLNDFFTDATVNTKLLIGGIAILAAGLYLLGAKRGPAIRKRQIARYRRKLAALET